MNDKNYSQDKDDRTPDNALWAEFVDQYGRLAHSEDPETTESDPQIDLTSEMLDDLELDGQLRILGKMSFSDADSFAHKVVAQTHPKSDSVDQDRPRLPFVKPSLVSARSEEITETSLETSTDPVVDAHVKLPPDPSPLDPPRRPKLALFASLAATLLIGCFIGSMWWFGAAPEIADSQPPDAQETDTGVLKGIADLPNNSQEDDAEAIVERDGDIDRFATEEDLALGSKEENSTAGSFTAPDEQAVKEYWNKFLESTKAADSDSTPSLVDAEQKIDFAAEPNEPSLSPLENGNNLEDQIVATPYSSGPSGRSKFDWNLAIQFRDDGMGSVALNDIPVNAIFLQDNAVFLLRRIAGELERRVQFLESRLGLETSGSIEIGSSTFRFENISELDETIDKVGKHIAELDIGALQIGDLMRLRAEYRTLMWDNRKNIGSIDLANKNSAFYTEDEAFTICSVLSDSQAILQDLAKKRLAWEEHRGIEPTHSKLSNSIAPKAFSIFAYSGRLQPPDPILLDRSLAGIQNLGPAELTRMLRDAPSLELFRNNNEFQQAKDFVFSNGTPAMKMRLTSDSGRCRCNGTTRGCSVQTNRSPRLTACRRKGQL